MLATLDTITAAPSGWTGRASDIFEFNHAERGLRLRVSRQLAARLGITERLEALVNLIGAR